LGGTIPQKQFTTGKWHRIVNKVSMNTVSAPGKGDKNGRVQAWLDGELALDVDTLRLRDYDTLHVDKFYLSTFHGGSTADWSPTHDCYIRFDNFTVSTDSIAVTINSSDSTGEKCEGANCGELSRIMMIRQARPEVRPVERFRVNGSRVGTQKAHYEFNMYK